MFKISNNVLKIEIKTPLTESSIPETEKYFIDIENTKDKYSSIELDLSKIKEIDFFGYQHFFISLHKILNKRSITGNNLFLQKKSVVFSNFESRYGLSFLN